MMNGTPPRGKALPSRPTQDNGYGGQNGYRNDNNQREREYGSSPQQISRNATPTLNGRMVLEGYRQDIMTGFEEEKPRYNPMNTSRPQSSMLLNVNDEIQVHLLVETALGDSKEYEILSQEEVDDLKRHVQALSQRIEQTKSNLAIQSKYRDAALNMARLYSTSGKSAEGDGKKRRSLLGHNRTPSHEVREADLERQQSERRCEELAAELWSLEKRLMVPQNRLLKHTAGILQMTHKGPTTPKPSKASHNGGIPGSPESMYTYHNARNSMEQISEEDFFDERSLYRNADALWEDATKDVVLQNGVGPSKEQMEMIALTEQKLEDLNNRLRDILVKADPQRSLPLPPRRNKNESMGETLQDHLEYLEANLFTIDREYGELAEQNPSELMGEYQQLADLHAGLSQDNAKLTTEHKILIQKYGELITGQEEMLATKEELMKSQQESNAALLRSKEEIMRIQQDHEAALAMSRDELMQSQKEAEAALVRSREELSRGQQASGAAQGNIEQTEAVIMGLWDIIQSGEEETRQRKLERRKTRTAQNLSNEDDSSDGDDDMDQPFSLQAFSGKVQWLYTQATRLKDQKKVLQRQIQQQRELNNKSDATKDAEYAQKLEELTRTTALLTRTEADADSVREQLALMMEQLDESRQQTLLRDQARSTSDSANVRQIQEELNQRIAKCAQLEEELQDLQDDAAIADAERQVKIGEAEMKVSELTKELAAAVAATTTLDSLVQSKEVEIQQLEQKIQAKQQEIAQLSQELTARSQYLQSTTQELATKSQSLQLATQELAAKSQSLQSTIQDLSSKDQTLQQKQAELTSTTQTLQRTARDLEETNLEIANLKTEVTIARAELDGAYGSRAQRKAEGAVRLDPAIQNELSELQLKNMNLAAEIASLRDRPSSSSSSDKNVINKENEEKMALLKSELAETIEEYEAMTKASIDWEKERESLEGTIDKLRDEREKLEAQLSDEQVRWLGMRSPGGETPGGMVGVANTSTTVLKNEFKKMMRDTRAEGAKSLRMEQELRRKLEEELRALKKQIGPGKSGLSQSYGSS